MIILYGHFPGKEHPLSVRTHKGKQAMMAAMSKIPAIWDKFSFKSFRYD